MRKVIDVSKHNGNVDWDILKFSIYGAIIRVGWGNDEVSQDDVYAKANMDACERLNIPYGVYLYSYALSKKDAISEANHVCRMIEGRKPLLGVWFDLEDADGYKSKNNLPLNTSNKELYNMITLEFCKQIKAKGIQNVGVYASKFIFETILSDAIFDKGIKRWVAQWSEKCTYTKKYEMWQYTSTDKIMGKKFDCSYYYGHNVPIKKNNFIDLNKRNQIDVIYNAYTMDGWVGEQKNGIEVTREHKPIRCIMVRLTENEVYVRVHSFKKNKWYPYVSGYDPSDIVNGYAGIGSDDIDAVQCYTKGIGEKNIYYQVFTEDIGWLPLVMEKNDYAGIIGKRVISFRAFIK